MADPGWAGMAGGVGAGDAIADIQNQRFKAIALAQQDALVRLKAQEQAEAVQARIENSRQAEADRQEARRNFNTLRLDKQVNELPTDLPLSASTVQNFTAGGVAPERFSPQGTSAPAPPPDIAAPEDSGAPQPMPGTIANSPAPNQMVFHRIPTAGEAQQQQQEQRAEMQLRQIENDPTASPQMRQFAHLRRILPKGENPPSDLFASPKVGSIHDTPKGLVRVGEDNSITPLGISGVHEQPTPHFAAQDRFDENGKPQSGILNTLTGEWKPTPGQGSVHAPAGAAQAEKERRDKQAALAMLDQLDTAIEGAKDYVGPGEGRVSSVEQMVGDAHKEVQNLGTKMLMTKMKVDASLGGMRAAASPQLLARWDNLLANKVTPENLHESVRAMREIIGAGVRTGTVKMKAPNGQVSDVSADQVEHFKRLGATVVP